MSDKITKFLRKLAKKDREQLEVLLMRLKAGDTGGLDVKHLAGLEDMFRVRQGRTRVIYRNDKKSIRILKISYRDEKTYKGL